MLAHAGQKVGLALVVQLAQNVVQQQNRVLTEQITDHCRLGQLHCQHAAALLALTAKHPGGLAVQQNFQILAVRPGQAEPGAQLGTAHGPHLFGQRRGGGGRGAHLVVQRQHLGTVGDVPIILRGDGSRRRQKLAAVLHNERAVLGQLLVVGVQQHIAVWRNIVAFQQGVLLGRQPHVPPQRHKVGPVDLAQCGIHKPPPSVRAALDQPQQVRLKDDGLKVPRQRCRAPNVCAV